MLVETLQSSPKAFSAFKPYKYDFAEVLFKDFGCHFAHAVIPMIPLSLLYLNSPHLWVSEAPWSSFGRRCFKATQTGLVCFGFLSQNALIRLFCNPYLWWFFVTNTRPPPSVAEAIFTLEF